MLCARRPCTDLRTIDRGSGLPLVLIPGIQGRWEYLRPSVDALAGSFRVISYSLSDLTSSASSDGLDRLSKQTIDALDARQIPRAIICGISFGGLVALRVAARFPERTLALVLVSAPGPDMRLSSKHETYTRYPWIFGPLFVVETPIRLSEEVRTAIPRVADRLRFSWRQARTLAIAPPSLIGMARRGRLLGHADLTDDCRRITAPTLIVTGERSLDRVVRVDSTMRYAAAIAGARAVQLDSTGHIGYLTRPQTFVELIKQFASSIDVVRPDAA